MMKLKNKLIVNPILIGLVILGAVSYKPVVASEINSQIIAFDKSANQITYRSDRFGFQFSYSARDFVIDNISIPSNGVASLLANIDIWTKKDAQKIRAGAYQGGTEYPPNVSVKIYNNRQRLPLPKWIKQSNDFSNPRDLKIARIAGYTGLKFQSSGLYENENVAFINPKNSRIIVITLSKNGTNNDAIYRRAFQQVINSFAL